MRQISMATHRGGIYGNVYDDIQYPTFFWGPRRMRKQCVPGLFVGPGNEATYMYTIAVTEDLARFRSETLLYSPFLSYRSVITTSSNKCSKH